MVRHARAPILATLKTYFMVGQIAPFVQISKIDKKLSQPIIYNKYIKVKLTCASYTRLSLVFFTYDQTVLDGWQAAPFQRPQNHFQLPFTFFQPSILAKPATLPQVAKLRQIPLFPGMSEQTDLASSAILP